MNTLLLLLLHDRLCAHYHFSGTKGEGVVSILRKDSTATAFGINNISPEPMVVQGTILPQAKLRYFGEKVVDPEKAGTWNIDRPQMKFVKPPPGQNREGAYTYGVMLVGSGPPPGPWEERVDIPYILALLLLLPPSLNRI